MVCRTPGQDAAERIFGAVPGGGNRQPWGLGGMPKAHFCRLQNQIWELHKPAVVFRLPTGILVAGGGVMEKNNCLRCNFRHKDNGNCTAVGGFCTAVPAAHCPLLRQYLDTGLTPEAVEALKLSAMGKAIAEITEFDGLPIDRLRELAEADKDGRVVVLPCKVGDTLWVARNPWTGELLKKPLDAYVNGMKMYSHGLYVNLLFDTRKINGTRDYEINHIGKTAFLTREEAEKALEAMKNE